MKMEVREIVVAKGGEGEGSRGGHIIGHTKSGKPIYEDHEHPSHASFTKEDHENASQIHRMLSFRATRGISGSYGVPMVTGASAKHVKSANHHLRMSGSKWDMNGRPSAVAKGGDGEGSRGGHVIGHTKSGKPIYQSHTHPDHQKFSADDHLQASELHDDIKSHINRARMALKDAGSDKTMSRLHDHANALWDVAAKHHESSAFHYAAAKRAMK